MKFLMFLTFTINPLYHPSDTSRSLSGSLVHSFSDSLFTMRSSITRSVSSFVLSNPSLAIILVITCVHISFSVNFGLSLYLIVLIICPTFFIVSLFSSFFLIISNSENFSSVLLVYSFDSGIILPYHSQNLINFLLVCTIG